MDALEAGRTAFDCGSEWSNAPLWYTSGEAISKVLDELSISSVLTESRVTSAASAAADSASSGADAVLSSLHFFRRKQTANCRTPPRRTR